uniref:Uncharacterized protein n=1 Tax=Glossina austeni TaxID=7395 RepID=A0A1A9VH03_GLOAU
MATCIDMATPISTTYTIRVDQTREVPHSIFNSFMRSLSSPMPIPKPEFVSGIFERVDALKLTALACRRERNLCRIDDKPVALVFPATVAFPYAEFPFELVLILTIALKTIGNSAASKSSSNDQTSRDRNLCRIDDKPVALVFPPTAAFPCTEFPFDLMLILTIALKTIASELAATAAVVAAGCNSPSDPTPRAASQLESDKLDENHVLELRTAAVARPPPEGLYAPHDDGKVPHDDECWEPQRRCLEH